MKLMTNEIATKLRAAYAKRDTLRAEDKPVVVKYFNPTGAGTWYVTDGYEDGGDWVLFGWADLGDPEMAELGYVSLNELAEFKGPLGLGIERDLWFGDDRKLGEFMT